MTSHTDDVTTDGLWWPEYTQVFYGTEHPGGVAPLYGYGALKGCERQFAGEPNWHSDDRWNGCVTSVDTHHLF